jgi:hypothetical protein
MSEWACSPLRVTAELAPSELRVEGVGTLRVKAADGDDHAPEPHVSARHGVHQLHPRASDTEHRDTHYTTTALTATLHGETATVKLNR